MRNKCVINIVQIVNKIFSSGMNKSLIESNRNLSPEQIVYELRNSAKKKVQI